MKLRNLDNEGLVDRIKQPGSAQGEAWEELSRRLNPLFRQIIGRVRQAVPAARNCEEEELLQIAHIKSFECARRFDRQRGVRFTTYLYQTVWGALEKFARAEERQAGSWEEIDPETAGDAPDPVELVIAQDTLARLQQALFSLSVAARLVCQLRFLQDLSIDEIAQSLKMNPDTVKSHLRRSRSLLQQALMEPQTPGDEERR